MSRRPSPTLRLPFQGAGSAWLAFGLTSGIYPQFQFNTFYYRATTFPLSMPVHAFTAVDDWLSLAIGDVRGMVPHGTAIEIFPIYLWDGALLHTYPNHLVPGGTNLTAFGSQVMAITFTKIIDPSPPQNELFGHWVWSPVPKNHINSRGDLTLTGLGHCNSLLVDLFTLEFDSEGNHWVPALVWGNNLFCDPIDRWRVVPKAGVYRRRFRKAPYTAQLVLPPPFPTPTG